jgi:hypothetical protein
VNTHIIDALRPERPELDPDWEAEIVRSILEDRRRGVLATERSGRGRLMRVALVAAAVIAIIGAAVVARNALPPDVVRPAAPKQEKIQKIDPSKATKLKFGDTLDVVADLPKTFNGDQVWFNAFAGDNTVVGSATPVLDETAQGGVVGAPRLAQTHPVMYDLDTKSLTLLDDRDRPAPTQVVNVSGNENTVIWAELVGMGPSTSEFTLYTYDRHSKEVTTFGAFDDPDGQIFYGDDLTLAGDTAYFSTFANPAKKGQGVFAVPVDGSKPPSLIAEGGEGVRISGDTLTYQLRNPKAKVEDRRHFTYDLRTHEATPVPVSAHADDPGFCGAEFSEAFETWCVGRIADGPDPSVATSSPALLRIKEASGRTTEFAPFDVGSLNAPVPHDVIALGPWTGIAVTVDGGQDREFLVNLDTKDVKVFPGNTSFAALSPDHSRALITSFGGKGPGPERVARVPD